MTVNLGPVGGVEGTKPGPEGGLGHNPRRLKRDVGPGASLRYANYSTVAGEWPARVAFLGGTDTVTVTTDLLLRPNIHEYRRLSEGALPYSAEIGPHGGGHYSIRYVSAPAVRVALETERSLQTGSQWRPRR